MFLKLASGSYNRIGVRPEPAFSPLAQEEIKPSQKKRSMKTVRSETGRLRFSWEFCRWGLSYFYSKVQLQGWEWVTGPPDEIRDLKVEDTNIILLPVVLTELSFLSQPGDRAGWGKETAILGVLYSRKVLDQTGLVQVFGEDANRSWEREPVVFQGFVTKTRWSHWECQHALRWLSRWGQINRRPCPQE